MRRLGELGIWCPETVNQVIDVDDRHVAVVGYRRLFVWEHRAAELILAIDEHRPVVRRPGGWLTGDGALLFRRRDDSWCRIELGTGEVVEIEPPGERPPRDPRWRVEAHLGNQVAVFEDGAPLHGGLGAWISWLRFSADGGELLAGAGTGGWIWPVAGGPGRAVPISAGGISGAAIAAVSDGALVRLDRPEIRLPLVGSVETLGLSTDVRRASVTTVRYEGLGMWSVPDVVVFDLDRGVELVRFATEGCFVPKAALSGDGDLLAVTDRGAVALFAIAGEPVSGRPPELGRWPEGTPSLGGRRLLVRADDRALAIDLDASRITGELALDSYHEIALSPDGSRVATWADGSPLAVRDGATLKLVREIEIPYQVTAVAFSPDNARVAVADGPTALIHQL